MKSTGQETQQWAEKQFRALLETAPDAMVDGTVQIGSRFLSRLLTELLDNAFEFSKLGTPVRFTSRVAGEALVFEVQDAGPGLTPPQIAGIGAFIQFERARFEQQGVGLGLHLVRRITELLGGKFSIESKAGAGAKVTVSLPQPSAAQS